MDQKVREEINRLVAEALSEPFTGWACDDCLFYLANGDVPDDPTFLERFEATTEGTTVELGGDHSEDCPNVQGGEWCGVADCYCETVEFSWSRCDTCGSQLGGHRSAVTFAEDIGAMAVTGPAEHYAASLGAEAGKAAASWVFDGNTDRETYRRILEGYEDGDPEILDIEPSPLSGEWADDPSPRDVLRDMGASEDDEDASFLLDEWQQGFSEGFWAEIVRVAQYQLAECDLCFIHHQPDQCEGRPILPFN